MGGMSNLALAIAVNLLLGAVLLALLVRLRGRDAVRLVAAAEALAQLRIHYPDAAGAVTLAADGRGALIELGGGTVGLLERRGGRWNARLLVAGDVAAVETDGENGLSLRFADFSWPRARLRLAGGDPLAFWTARLEALRGAVASRGGTDPHHA